MRTPSGRLAARQRLSSRRAFLERWPYRSSPVAEPWRDSVWDSPLRIRRCGLGDVYRTMMSGTGEWRARPTATEPTMRCVAWDELPTMIATFSCRHLRGNGGENGCHGASPSGQRDLVVPGVLRLSAGKVKGRHRIPVIHLLEIRRLTPDCTSPEPDHRRSP